MPGPSTPVTHRRILVTGGSRGIGRAAVLAFAGIGDQVLALGRAEAALGEVEEAARSLPGTVRTALADVADLPRLRAVLAEALPPGAPLDVAVVNAGISQQTPIAGDAAVDEAWWRQIETNLTGAWYTVRAARPYLAAGSRLVLIASDLARMGAPGFAGYAASKHGLLGLMRALALELAPVGVTVNAVCPGWVDTAMARQSFAEMAAELGLPASDVQSAEVEALPLRRLVQPEEVAALVQFLAGPAAAAITGQVFGIDAGTTPF